MLNQKAGSIQLHFLGAAGMVTGSKYLVDTGDFRILVDCGLFQGIKKLRKLNWEYLPIPASDIDLVLLTHGHLDHVGFLPRLMNMGFKGEIWASNPTLNVAEIILRDSAKIQEEEAERANREGYSRHRPAKALYTIEDAEKVLPLMKAIHPGEWKEIREGIRVRFRYVGHIIGATFIELDVHGKRLVFSGDVGRMNDELMAEPELPERAEILLIESTYGDRLHPSMDSARKRFREIVTDVVEGGGTLIIPSFAVERAQTMMYLLWKLKDEGLIPDIPLIMDSPMSANVLRVFVNNMDWHKLPYEDCQSIYNSFRIVSEIEETYEVISDHRPKIVIAGSGMITGGRVLHYLQHYISKPSTTVLLVGFQAAGTRGRRLMEHATEIKFFGKYHAVKAKIEHLNGLSAHADQSELLHWMSALKERPEQIHIVHGEAQASDVLRMMIYDNFGWEANIPELYSIEVL